MDRGPRHLALGASQRRTSEVIAGQALARCFRDDCFGNSRVHDHAGFNHCGRLLTLQAGRIDQHPVRAILSFLGSRAWAGFPPPGRNGRWAASSVQDGSVRRGIRNRQISICHDQAAPLADTATEAHGGLDTSLGTTPGAGAGHRLWLRAIWPGVGIALRVVAEGLSSRREMAASCYFNGRAAFQPALSLAWSDLTVSAWAGSWARLWSSSGSVSRS